jgi:hypothetical protein
LQLAALRERLYRLARWTERPQFGDFFTPVGNNDPLPGAGFRNVGTEVVSERFDTDSFHRYLTFASHLWRETSLTLQAPPCMLA